MLLGKGISNVQCLEEENLAMFFLYSRNPAPSRGSLILVCSSQPLQMINLALEDQTVSLSSQLFN